MTVHQLREHHPQGKPVAIAACGETFRRQLNHPMPAELSAWAGDVTCHACLARRVTASPATTATT